MKRSDQRTNGSLSLLVARESLFRVLFSGFRVPQQPDRGSIGGRADSVVTKVGAKSKWFTRSGLRCRTYMHILYSKEEYRSLLSIPTSVVCQVFADEGVIALLPVLHMRT